MRQNKRNRAERLRLIVDTLPYETRVAMIEGLEQYDIIAGAYSSRDGGVCPMLAAHRCGGRTNFRSFARAWDRFTGAKRARRASDRELRTLVAQLERSVWREDQARLHSVAGTLIDRPREPEPEPAREERTATQSMGAWLIPFRNLEDYARALQSATTQFDRQAQLDTAEPRDDRQPQLVEA